MESEKTNLHFILQITIHICLRKQTNKQMRLGKVQNLLYKIINLYTQLIYFVPRNYKFLRLFF